MTRSQQYLLTAHFVRAKFRSRCSCLSPFRHDPTATGFPRLASIRVGSVAPVASMLEPRSGHTATLLPDGRVLIAGGMRRNQDFYKSAELYDPSTGKFQATGEMNERRVGQVAVLLRSGKVLIAGGWVGHSCTDSAELYDPPRVSSPPLPAR